MNSTEKFQKAFKKDHSVKLQVGTQLKVPLAKTTLLIHLDKFKSKKETDIYYTSDRLLEKVYPKQ